MFALGKAGLSPILSSFSLRFQDDKTLAVTVPSIKHLKKIPIFIPGSLPVRQSPRCRKSQGKESECPEDMEIDVGAEEPVQVSESIRTRIWCELHKTFLRHIIFR
jgi:hypothetical protein